MTNMPVRRWRLATEGELKEHEVSIINGIPNIPDRTRTLRSRCYNGEHYVEILATIAEDANYNDQISIATNNPNIPHFGEPNWFALIWRGAWLKFNIQPWESRMMLTQLLTWLNAIAHLPRKTYCAIREITTTLASYLFSLFSSSVQRNEYAMAAARRGDDAMVNHASSTPTPDSQTDRTAQLTQPDFLEEAIVFTKSFFNRATTQIRRAFERVKNMDKPKTDALRWTASFLISLLAVMYLVYESQMAKEGVRRDMKTNEPVVVTPAEVTAPQATVPSAMQKQEPDKAPVAAPADQPTGHNVTQNRAKVCKKFNPETLKIEISNCN